MMMTTAATARDENGRPDHSHEGCDSRLALLWDVDGPLNPQEAKERPSGYETVQMRGYGRFVKASEIWLNPEHGPRILALAAELGAQNWWATAWRAEANRQIGPFLGLPEFPALFLDVPSTYPEWKWPHVLARFEGRPLIWFDDEFVESWNAPRREQFLAARGDTPTLLHYVDPRVGLRDSDLDAAREWVHARKLCST